MRALVVMMVGQDPCLSAGQRDSCSTQSVHGHCSQGAGGTFASGKQDIELAFCRIRRDSFCKLD